MRPFEVRRLPWITWMASKFSHKCPYKGDTKGDDTDTQRRKVCEDRGGSDKATSP